MDFYVYIIYSPTIDIFYKGFTTDFNQRLQQHNNGESQYTSKSNDWKLVFVRKFAHKKEALKYEKMLKRQNRKYILWLLTQPFNLINY